MKQYLCVRKALLLEMLKKNNNNFHIHIHEAIVKCEVSLLLSYKSKGIMIFQKHITNTYRKNNNNKIINHKQAQRCIEGRNQVQIINIDLFFSTKVQGIQMT